MNTETHEKVPTQLIFELVSVLLLACAALAEVSFTFHVWFTAVYTFACVTASMSWYRARHILDPRMSKHLGPAIGSWLTLGLPVILIVASASHMIQRSI